MGKRGRQRGRAPAGETSEHAETSDYADADGNVLTLRRSISQASVAKLAEPAGPAAASTDDIWRRRTELLFERFAVRWSIAGLPLAGQAELLGRYRMADRDTQDWVRRTLEDHLLRHQPELTRN